MDLALHQTRSWWHLEKWYADVVTPAGDVLVVLLAAVRAAGVWFGRVTADLSLAGGGAVRGDARAPAPAGGPDRLRFGPARIEGDTLSWTTAGLSGALEVRPRSPAATMREPLLARGRRSLWWTIEVPDADVTGTLRWPGGSMSITGRGYRDRVWTDFPPWAVPLRTLRWGRLVSASHATAWIDAEVREGRLAWRWEDGRTLAEGPPELGRDRVLADGVVADLPGLRLGPLRGALRRISRDLHQTRWAAAASLHGERGWAVHEEVRWR